MKSFPVRNPAVAIVGLILGAFLMFRYEPKPRPTMLNFDHSKHRPISCEVCHRGVLAQAHAVVPTGEVCAKCHASSPDATPQGQDLWRATEVKGLLRWPVSYQLPEHVYFSHRRHVGMGRLRCDLCHGDMTSQSTPLTSPAQRQQMADCVSCHRERGASDDCAHCHK